MRVQDLILCLQGLPLSAVAGVDRLGADQGRAHVRVLGPPATMHAPALQVIAAHACSCIGMRHKLRQGRALARICLLHDSILQSFPPSPAPSTENIAPMTELTIDYGEVRGWVGAAWKWGAGSAGGWVVVG